MSDPLETELNDSHPTLRISSGSGYGLVRFRRKWFFIVIVIEWEFFWRNIEEIYEILWLTWAESISWYFWWYPPFGQTSIKHMLKSSTMSDWNTPWKYSSIPKIEKYRRSNSSSKENISWFSHMLFQNQQIYFLICLIVLRDIMFKKIQFIFPIVYPFLP